MRIAIMAAGAVGGYFGGRMAAAGHDVAFIARGPHRDAIRRDGLKIESALGDLHLKNVDVTDDAAQIGPVDLVLFAVKLWDRAEPSHLKPRAGRGPLVRIRLGSRVPFSRTRAVRGYFHGSRSLTPTPLARRSAACAHLRHDC